MVEIIIGCVVFIAILIMIFIVFRNKFCFSIIKLEDAENNIDMLLEKKLQLLNEARPVVMKELKLNEFLEEVSELTEKELSHFEMHQLLKNSYNELMKAISDNEKLLKSEDLVTILNSLNDTEEEMIGTIKFYNDSAVTFNGLIGSFPSNIVAFLCRYRARDFYSNEKREMYAILNDE